MIFLWPKPELKSFIELSPGNFRPQKAHLGDKGFAMIPKNVWGKIVFS
jgi:hypothetical protein